MVLTFTEENYLKSLFKISIENENQEVGTTTLAAVLGVKAATANDMLKKLKEKDLVLYEKYGKITLSMVGRTKAIEVLRKHRLWETFLYEKLEFSWDEIHAVAEQLEHIQSEKLVEQLDKFLGYPAFDPHGDPIPNQNGEMKVQFKETLSQIPMGTNCKMVGVKDNSSSFLQYVGKLGLGINVDILVVSIQEYDAMMLIEVGDQTLTISSKFSENIFVVR
jgi:DtxR family Mn-dependent transcriptional regulator